jgi:hypothetical protein
MKIKSKIIVGILLIFLIFTVGANAEESKYQASKLVDEYVLDGETSTSYGPYNYNGNEYFVTELKVGSDYDSYGTVFVIDKDKGTIIQDRTTYYEVSKIHLHVENIGYYDYLTTYNENVVVIRDDIAYWDDSQEFWDDIDDSATKTEEKNAAKEAASLCGELVIKLTDELDTTQDMIKVLGDIYDGYPTDSEIESYVELSNQLNSNYKSTQKTVVASIEKYPEIYDEFTDTSSAFGIEKYDWEQYEKADLQTLGNLDDTYNVLTADSSDLWIQDNIDWAWESMNDRISTSSTSEPSIPGFEILSSFSVILLIVFIMKKRK